MLSNLFEKKNLYIKLINILCINIFLVNYSFSKNEKNIYEYHIDNNYINEKKPIIEAAVEVFFNDKNILIKSKNNMLPLVPMNFEIPLNLASPEMNDHLSKNNRAKLEIDRITGPSFCNDIFKLNGNHFRIKDPKFLMKTYSECHFFLIDKDTKQDVAYFKFSLNRSFRSWCEDKKNYGNEISKTVNAVLNFLNAKKCDEDIVEKSNDSKSPDSLKDLSLDKKKITDISPIASFVRLRTLWLNDNLISNILPISTLSDLVVIGFSNNKINNIYPLKNLKKIRWLFLRENKISDVTPLKDLPKIKLLLLENNNITDYHPLLDLIDETESREADSLKITVTGNPFLQNYCKKFSSVQKTGFINQEKLCKPQFKGFYSKDAENAF